MVAQKLRSHHSHVARVHCKQFCWRTWRMHRIRASWGPTAPRRAIYIEHRTLSWWCTTCRSPGRRMPPKTDPGHCQASCQYRNVVLESCASNLRINSTVSQSLAPVHTLQRIAEDSHASNPRKQIFAEKSAVSLATLWERHKAFQGII